MAMRLSDIFGATNLNSIEADDHSYRATLHISLLLAILPACIQYGTLSLATIPSTLGIEIPRMLSVCIGVVSVCISAFILLAKQHDIAKNPQKTALFVIAVTSVLAALSLLMVVLGIGMKNIFLLMGIAFSGLGMPFALLACVRTYSHFSRSDVLVNSFIGFILVDCFYVVSQIFKQTLVPLLILLFALCALCCCVLLTSANATHFETEEENALEEGGEDESPKIKSLILSVPCFGTLLFMFTKGVVAGGQPDMMSIWVSAIGALIVVILALFLYLRYRRKFRGTYSMFLLLDIGLPGLAVVAIFIKLIQLEFFFSTIFLYLMKAYFLVLLTAFWIKAVQFVSLNRGATIKCCAAISFCEVLVFGIGALCALLSNGDSVILGLVTALYLIIAVISFGYNLILLVQSKEPDEPCDLTELNEYSVQVNAEEVSRAISSEYALTPRESEVLLELTYGHSSSYIAHVLYISDNTVRTHMKNIYKKLGVHSREELIEVMRIKQAEQ